MIRRFIIALMGFATIFFCASCGPQTATKNGITEVVISVDGNVKSGTGIWGARQSNQFISVFVPPAGVQGDAIDIKLNEHSTLFILPTSLVARCAAITRTSPDQSAADLLSAFDGVCDYWGGLTLIYATDANSHSPRLELYRIQEDGKQGAAVTTDSGVEIKVLSVITKPTTDQPETGIELRYPWVNDLPEPSRQLRVQSTIYSKNPIFRNYFVANFYN